MRRDEPRGTCTGLLSVVALMMAMTWSPSSAASLSTIRGRVVDGDAAPLPGVRVLARAPTLTAYREVRTDARGTYVLDLLPPGDYVISFERDGFVTAKHTTTLDASETRLLDTALAPAGDPDELISVSIDEALESPTASTTMRRSALDLLPLEGGVFSVLALAPGPLDTRTHDALVTVDGAPVRFLRSDLDRPLLDPGAMAQHSATLILGGVPADTARFGSGVVNVVMPSGGTMPSGRVQATLTEADLLSDTIDNAGRTREPAGAVELGGGLPLHERRTWLFGAGRYRSELVESQARLSPLVLSGRTEDRFWTAKATHALHPDHRVQANVLFGDRDRRGTRPPGGVSVEERSALERRRLSHRVVSAAYAGVLGRDVRLVGRVSGERRTVQSRALGAAGPAVWDPLTGGVAGGPACGDCRLDARSSTTWSLTAHRPLTIASDSHLLSLGMEHSQGHIDLADAQAADRVDLLASRLLVVGGAVFPAVTTTGASWLVRPQGAGRLAHAADGIFVSDEWRRGATLTVRAGARWQRQRLLVDASRPVLDRSALHPRLHVSWQPHGRGDWNLFTGVARYEADLLDLTREPLPPAGGWFSYSGPPINTDGGMSPVPTERVAAQVAAWVQANAAEARFSGLEAPVASVVGRSRAGLGPTSEWIAGISRAFGDELRLHADLLWRRRAPVGETAPMLDATARLFERPADVDLGLLTTHYTALSVHAEYEVGLRAGVAANYTLSRLRGERADPAFAPPAAEWAAPAGDLTRDRRHRLRLWGHVVFLEDKKDGIAHLAVVQTFESEQPYGTVSWIDAAPWLPDGAAGNGVVLLPYYLTGRDAHRTKAALRTDLSARYARLIPGLLRGRIFVQLQALNLFDKERVRDLPAFTVARTAFTHPGELRPFDPFTEVPQPGVHWDLDPRLTTALETAPETMPRTYRLSVGVEF